MSERTRGDEVFDLKYPKARRGINEAMYDRHQANPTATTLIVTRCELELLCEANGYPYPPIPGDPVLLLGKPVVILEDSEMSW